MRKNRVKNKSSNLLYRFKILFLRIVGYEKPLRVALLKYLTLKYKTFRPHYETILLESCLEAKKLGYSEVSVLELGVAGGNGIIALEKYKKKIQNFLDIKINIYGFDLGKGLPGTDYKEDAPYIWKAGDFKVNKDILHSRISSKVFYGDIKNTLQKFANTKPKNISSIFFDLDLYSSTRNFLSQITKIEKYLCPRVYCYFDDVFNPNYYINQFNGENLAISEFNKKNKNIKIGFSLDNIKDFKFPLAKNMVFMLHKFNHPDYTKYIGFEDESSLTIGNKKVRGKFL
jgi:hypothetical protein